MLPKVVRNTAIQHSKEDEMALEGGDESIVGLSISLDGESIQLPEEASLQHHAITTTSRVIQKEVTANQPTVRRVDVIVADGGILLSEIDTKTMRSKKVSNLFVTGDLLDIRRPSGGFSLQLCWTTGYVAGTHAVSE